MSTARVFSTMRIMLLLTSALLAAAVALSGQPVWAAEFGLQGAAKTTYKANLTGGPDYRKANGEAKWTSKSGERELEVEIEDAKKLKGKKLTVRVGGKYIGKMKVNSLGRAAMHRSTESGQSVPKSVKGKSVTVRTPGGKLVVSGPFKKI